MKRACISLTIAAALVVTGTFPAAAQEADETAIPRVEAALPAGRYAQFDITPAMARMLSRPTPSHLTAPLPSPELHSLAQGSARTGGMSRTVAAAVALGFIGMFAGATIGAKLDAHCACDDPSLAGGFYGVLIGTPLGVWFGTWLAGR